jgi:hypothetical protein
MAIIWVGTGRFSAYIGPVQDYIDRVVAADVAAGNTLGLEVGVRDAYDVFIRDSINVGDLGTSGGVLSQANSIIKAAPIMAGARTLAGALTPLVGTAPTRFGTAGGWNYNRKTGLQANGTNNYLDSNRSNSADPQNSKHVAVFTSESETRNATRAAIASRSPSGAVGSTHILTTASVVVARINTSGTSSTANATPFTGLFGGSRSSDTQCTVRFSGASTTINESSSAPAAVPIDVFSRNGGDFSNARFAFYSIGESLNLALLDTRITALINAFAAAIP